MNRTELEGGGFPPNSSPVEVRPLGIALGVCAISALTGGLLAGLPAPDWYDQVVRPGFGLPPVLILLGTIFYYPVYGVALYRTLAHVGDARPRRTIAGLLVGVMALQALWNAFFRLLPSPPGAVLGSLLMVALLAGAVTLLLRHERVSAWLLGLYLLWTTYELVYVAALWQLN